MKLRNVQDIYPLSPMQQGLLFHSLYEPSSGVYFTQLSCCLHGNLNVAAFRRAWHEVVARHDVLRTAFLWKGLKDPVQIVHWAVDLPWHEEDWANLGDAEQNEKWRQYLNDDCARGFDLERAPLLRIALVRIADDRYYFCWSNHHILMDGWCKQIVIGEVLQLYEADREGRLSNLLEPRPYRDYIAWLQNQDWKKVEAFWCRELKGFRSPNHLELGGPRDEAKPKGENNRNRGKAVFVVDHELSEKVIHLARSLQITISSFVQGAWAFLIHRYSGQDDIVFGATVSGRPAVLPGVEKMIGLFINTLPVRVGVDAQETVRSYLRQLHRRQMHAREFEYSPLVKVQQWSEVAPGTALFETLFVFENYPLERLAGCEKSVDIVDVQNTEKDNYAFTLVAASGAALGFTAFYDPQRFCNESVMTALTRLQFVLAELVLSADRAMYEVSLLSRLERHHVLTQWNQARIDLPCRVIHEIFEEQAERIPDAAAILWEDVELNYRELNHRSNQLGRYLRTLGVGPEVRVGICMRRSPNMIIGLVAILKAGGAYVPLDPVYPAERLRYILDDARMHVLLTDKVRQHPLSSVACTIVSLDREWEHIENESGANLELNVNSRNLAYVIYTSGSTGRPKGTVIEHASTVALIQWAHAVFDKEDLAGVLSSTSLCFDLSVFEIIFALCGGGTVILVENALQLPQLRWRERVTLLNTVPSIMAELLRLNGFPGSVRTVNLAGEVLNRSLVDDIYENTAVGRVLNLYGPTEDTTYSTFAHMVREDHSVTIGKPIRGTQVYILDENLSLVPLGMTGELMLAGSGLARGYLRRPDLTAERFLPNPFSDFRGERMYKTGDLARYQADGSLKYLGRRDHQVKIRGYRIELGEVEAALAECEGVQQCAVAVRELGGQKQLVGYIVAQHGGAPSADQMRSYLADRLPQYLTPPVFVHLADLPLNPNGKLDRAALPMPEMKDVRPSGALLPRDSVETYVAGLWMEILGVHEIGIRDNFFDRGGNSLRAIAICTRVQESYQTAVPLRAIFEWPTIEQFAAFLRKEHQSILPSTIVPIRTRGSRLPLFCVHPSGALANCYMDLAGYLGREQPFYGLQPRGLLEGETAIANVEEMAAAYIEDILVVQPKGPYQLAGWSMGTVVAFEMARQMADKGLAVSLLALFDGIFPDKVYTRSLDLEGQLREIEAEILGKIAELELGTSTEELGKLDRDAQFRFCYEESRAREVTLVASVSFPAYRRYIRTVASNGRAWRTYKPHPYKGIVTMFTSGHRLDGSMKLWQTVAIGGMKIIELPGKHDDFCYGENARLLADRLKVEIENSAIGIAGEAPASAIRIGANQ